MSKQEMVFSVFQKKENEKSQYLFKVSVKAKDLYTGTALARLEVVQKGYYNVALKLN